MVDNHLKLPPNHLVHHPCIGLDDADDFGGNVLVHVVRDRDAREAVADEGDGDVDALEKADGVDAAEDEASFVQGLGALGRGPDAHGREGMADGGEERGLLREGAAIGHNRKGIHLEAVVVVEAQGLMLDYARIELEPGGLEALPAARMAAVQDGHIVLLGHLIDGNKERQEVLLRVDVLLAMGAQEDILPLLQAQALVDVAGLDLSQVVVQDLRHRRTSHVGALLGQTGVGEIAAGMLGVGHIDIGDDIDNPAVRLLRQALVLAAVAGLHVEDRDMQPLRADDAEARVRVPQHQHRIGLDFHHQLVALGDDIAHRLAQVLAHGVHVHVRIGQLQILEEHTVKVIVVILPRMSQNRVEILPTLVDYGRQPDNLRPRPDDDQKLQLPVILKCCHIYFTGSK